MKTRRKKLQYNITKKKHKNFSRKKKTYKNKTLKGGNYIIIATALGISAAASGFGWGLYSKKKRKNSKNRLDKEYEKIGDVDDPNDRAVFLDQRETSGKPPALRFNRLPMDTANDQTPDSQKITPNECKIDLVGPEIERITRPYFTSPDFKEVLRRIKKIYSDMDKNPKVGDMISIHSDFYKDEMFQKQNKAYELFIPDLDTNVFRKVPIQYRPPMEIIYKDSNNYYCIYNGGVIEENSIFKLAMSVSRGGANLGAVLEQQDKEDLLDPVLDVVDREEAEKRQFNRVVGDKIIQNLGSIEERKTLSMEKKKIRYKFFVSLNNLFFESDDIREFYDLNITSFDEKDYDIIKAFIFGETEEYKHYISVYGTNAMKKIKLLNLISSNTICKFLMDYIEQELSVSDGITKGTQIYDLISESIRINWRINNIYDEDEKFILYQREALQFPSEDKYELYNKPIRGLVNGKRMNEQQYVGGSGETIPQETREEKIQRRRRKIEELKQTKRFTQSGERLPPPSYDVDHISGWAYFLSIIQDKLYFLNSQKQIPYEVLLILLGFILSRRGDSTMADNKLVLVAINIVYNEIFTYSRQVLYELFNESEVIKKKHRAQPGAWSRIIYSIPISTIDEKVKTREILVKPGGYIMKRLVQLSKDLVQTIPGFKKKFIEYFSVETDCKAFISESEIKELEKKILYSVYYFMLENLDDEWNEETIKEYKTNLDLLCDQPFDNVVDTFGEGSVITTLDKIGLLSDYGGVGLVSKVLNLRSWQHITGPIT